MNENQAARAENLSPARLGRVIAMVNDLLDEHVLPDALHDQLLRWALEARGTLGSTGAAPECPPRAGAPGDRAVTGPTPKRDLIAGVLRARIADGTYPAGSYLPTRRELAREHDMSVTPVGDACAAMEKDGLLCGAARGRYIIQPAGHPPESTTNSPGNRRFAPGTPVTDANRPPG